jgi:STE24 endopeptidase
MQVVPLLTFITTPLRAARSRKHEFEADAFACEHASGKDLQQALIKLYKDNASTLTPDPLFVAFYHSHPPASQRLARLTT